jgi:hypothetical protein
MAGITPQEIALKQQKRVENHQSISFYPELKLWPLTAGNSELSQCPLENHIYSVKSRTISFF